MGRGKEGEDVGVVWTCTWIYDAGIEERRRCGLGRDRLVFGEPDGETTVVEELMVVDERRLDGLLVEKEDIWGDCGEDGDGGLRGRADVDVLLVAMDG